MSNEFGDFLRSRRAKLSPEEVGLPRGGNRRVPGLRREEVAALASISADYISRLEQGRIRPSDAVLDSLARALRLKSAERVHFFALACRTVSADVEHRDRVSTGLLRLLQAVEPQPAYVMSRALDILAWNPTASLLLDGLERRSRTGRNLARLIFLDEEFRELVGPPVIVGGDVVAALRIVRSRGRRDARVEALIAELSEGSSAFRALWDEHAVAMKTTGRDTFNHPQVGDIVLDWDRLVVPGGGGQVLMVYSAAPGTPSATALTLLGTLAATAVRS